MSPYEIPECAGTPYRPSNGAEGEMFREEFCVRCDWYRHKDCPILDASVWHDVGDPKCPSQWTHDKQGRPTCLAFLQKSEGGK